MAHLLSTTLNMWMVSRLFGDNFVVSSFFFTYPHVDNSTTLASIPRF